MTETSIKRHGAGFRLQTQQRFPASCEEVYPFFANAGNLQEITPPSLRFQIVTSLPIKMGVGTLIDYAIRLHGIPIRWRTEITAWEPPHRFVDQQLRGPYKWWIHEHTFEERDGVTVANDVVDYGVPLAFLVHPLFVRSNLERIFQFRQCALAARFGELTSPAG